MVRAHRRGFTMVELLIVMGIILVLMSIGVLGFFHIEKVAAEKATTTRMEVLNSITQEFTAGGGATATLETNNIVPTIMNININSTPKLTDGSTGNVNEGTQERDWYMSNSPRIVQYAGIVLQTFAQNPGVKAMLSQLPAEAMLKKAAAAGTGNSVGPYVDEHGKNPLPVILDGWKNPIVYVPSGGLTVVYMGGPIPRGDLVTQDPNVHTYTVLSVDGRPFWASAGPDGDLRTGDDNIYSCPVRFIKIN